MTIYLSTSDKQEVIVELKNKQQLIDEIISYNKYGSQVLLPSIVQILKKHHLSLKDLTGIELETGPGSYTGLKVGAAVANALAFALKIPVNGKEVETNLRYT